MSEPVVGFEAPIRLEFDYTPGRAQSRFLRAIEEGRIVGHRCPACGKVYVPARGLCPADGIPIDEEVEVADTGTITTFCVVNIPFAGQAVECPYVCAAVLLDGADISVTTLIQEIPVGDVRMGMRVKAVWAPPEERGPTMESIRYFKPSGEPDVAIEGLIEGL